MRRYKIDRSKARVLKDGDILKHKDFDGLMANYQKATKPLYKVPLYRDRKTFLALVLILLVLWLVFEAVDEEQNPAPDESTNTEQVD